MRIVGIVQISFQTSFSVLAPIEKEPFDNVNFMKFFEALLNRVGKGIGNSLGHPSHNISRACLQTLMHALVQVFQ